MGSKLDVACRGSVGETDISASDALPDSLAGSGGMMITVVDNKVKNPLQKST